MFSAIFGKIASFLAGHSPITIENSSRKVLKNESQD